MNQNERKQFCAFYRRSRSDILQARTPGSPGWGPVWTYAPRDSKAATQCLQMLRRIHQHKQIQLRHARHARLHARECQNTATSVVIVTEVPDRAQTVFRLDDGCILHVDAYLTDDVVEALEKLYAAG